ncbi:MAG: hypothetical protein HWE15_13150 [Algoriphagus sp.]|uniref:alpha/beta hydrolase n=1 Tax=Algoriphagus sp. TaxID=1872435 RepID=UPI0017A504A6|nr:alpha/beta hydrolase-fold protein [Algoriphagus sp.]NVJ87252.1 hypothetical protein [Algoriphagus sp.]
MYKTILLVLITCLTLDSASAQLSSRTTELTISSKILGDERKLKIHLPKNYSEEKSYPVIYTTDGGFDNYEIAQGYIDILSIPSADVLPPSILVGIIHNDRSNELRAFGSYKGRQFIQHIEQELVPFIDSTYSTSGFNTMIGHSDGAEFNHYLMTSKNNSFRGFVSMSTAFNEDMKPAIAQFYANYAGDHIYHFIANGTRDIAPRKAAGNSIDSLYQLTSNKNISFKKQTFKADHQSLTSVSLLVGLQFIFQDYRNLENYTSIIDFRENYMNTINDNYGIDLEYNFADLDQFLIDIIARKDVDEYHYWVEFVNENNLVYGGKMDYVSMAWNYFDMELYGKTIEFMNKAIEEFDAINPIAFYNLLARASSEAYINENRTSEAVTFLERSRAVLPERYYLNMSYRIANFSLTNGVDTQKGRDALEYCKIHFKKNRLFSMDDLRALEQK